MSVFGIWDHDVGNYRGSHDRSLCLLCFFVRAANGFHCKICVGLRDHKRPLCDPTSAEVL